MISVLFKKSAEITDLSLTAKSLERKMYIFEKYKLSLMSHQVLNKCGTQRIRELQSNTDFKHNIFSHTFLSISLVCLFFKTYI